MSYTTKTDFWGNTTYYDEKGKLIGKEDSTWLGGKVIKDEYGNVVGKPVKDIWGRETIELEHSSFFFGTSKKTILKDGELEDWEMCESCGEYIDGDEKLLNQVRNIIMQKPKGHSFENKNNIHGLNRTGG